MFVHSKTKKASLILGWWVALSLVVSNVVGWYERTASERQAALRYGVLNDFQEEQIDIRYSGHECWPLSYRVYVPNATASKPKLPVFLYLHGSGERGADNALQLRAVPSLLMEKAYRKDFPCIVVAPQCPTEMNWTSFRHNFIAEDSASCDPIVAIIEKVLKNPQADRNRVYLVGFSMGSFGAWELAADNPAMFAAVVPIAGGGSATLAESLVEVPIWAVHGDQDRTCPAEQTRKIVAKLQAANGDVRYSEFPGVGHQSWQQAFRQSSEMLQWMFRQCRNHE